MLDKWISDFAVKFPTLRIKERRSSKSITGETNSFRKILDEDILESWSNFDSEVEDYSHNYVSPKIDLFKESKNNHRFNSTRGTSVCCESDVSSAFFGVKDAVEYFSGGLGIHGEFSGANGQNLIGVPDLIWTEVFPNIQKEIVKLAIEIKTPWALTEFTAEDLQNPKQDLKTVLSQIYGYMSLNHLKYGVLTTYNCTYFLRRIPPPSDAEVQLSTLQISPAIHSHSADGLSNRLLFSWLYLLHLLHSQEYLYNSPRGTQINSVVSSVKNLMQHKYEMLDMSPNHFKFSKPFVYNDAVSVVKGEFYKDSTSSIKCLFKIVDSSKLKENALELRNEVQVYSALESLQGTVIPVFYGYYSILGGIHLIAIEDCGPSIPMTEISLESRNLFLTALEAFHSSRYLHGDIRLENFVYASNSTVKIIDFGRSKHADDKAEQLKAAEVDVLMDFLSAE